MGTVTVRDINIYPLKKIGMPGGGVLRGLKKCDPGFVGFGEAYFSQIEFGVIKAWKLHKEMTMNLVVPVGDVHFGFIDTLGGVRRETIGLNNYARLSVPPGIWFGFQGISRSPSLLLNIASIEHAPDEIVRKEEYEFKYDWEVTT